MNLDHFFQLANRSGGVLYVIAAMFLVALTVIVERSWFLQRAAADSHAALAQLDKAEHVDAALLRTLATRYRKQPAGRMFDAALKLHGYRDREQLSAGLEEIIMREAPGIDRFLWMLDTIVTLAPLLGLFGTILGMFNAFQVLSNPGNAPTQVTGGVAEALIATASGLFVAMIGLVFFNGLHTRVRGVVHQLETLKSALANRMIGASAIVGASRHDATHGVMNEAAHEPLHDARDASRKVVGLSVQGS